MALILKVIGYSARSFLRTPGTTCALLFTIALGIGANVSIQAFILGMQPVFPPASLGRIVSIFSRGVHATGSLTYRDYVALESHRELFEWVGAAQVSPVTVNLPNQTTNTLSIGRVTRNLAEIFQLPIHQGVIVSDRLWKSDFGSRANIRGLQIGLGGVDARLGGVAPQWLEGVYRDRGVDLWTVLDAGTPAAGDGQTRNLWIIGRVRPNISVQEAEREVRATLPDRDDIEVTPYTGMMPEAARSQSRVHTVLSLAAGAVFLIACANVASFLLARASARSVETSVRVALGAARGQLAREVISDSVVISIAGGVLGAVFALWTSHVVPSLLFEEDASHIAFTPDLEGLLWTCAACVAMTVLCGLLPGVAIPYGRPAEVLRRESAGPPKGIRRTRSALVVAQMASCCALVLSTAILFDGFRAALQTTAGSRLDHPVLASVVADPGAGFRYFQRVQQAVEAVRGVSVKTWSGKLPGAQPAWQTFRIEPRRTAMRDASLDIVWLTPDSREVSSMRMLAGRSFGIAAAACRTAILNEQAAKQLYGGSPVGRTVRDPMHVTAEIIGVVRIRNQTQRRAAIYYYADQRGIPPKTIAGAHFQVPSLRDLARVEMDTNVVSPGYFDVVGFPTVGGRAFDGKGRTDACRIAVVNEQAADLFFAGKPVGSAVIDDSGVRTEIVGVVHTPPIGTFQRRVEPAIYFPMGQDYLRSMTLIFGARDSSRAALDDLRGRVGSVRGRGPFPPIVQTFDEYLSHSALAPLRIAVAILGTSSAIALLLSVLGLFGAMSDAARQRRRDLALRITLGAQRRHVIGQVFMEGGRLACAGAVAGIAGSLLVSRSLSRIVPGNGGPALWVWCTAPLLLALATALASVIPARRASMVNPLTVLRDDN